MGLLEDFKTLIGKGENSSSSEQKTNSLKIVDVIAPSSIQELQGQLRVEEKFSRSFFVFS